MPTCKSLVGDEHLARIRSLSGLRVLSETDFDDGLHLVEVEGDCVPSTGGIMKIIIIDGDTIRFRDDVDT